MQLLLADSLILAGFFETANICNGHDEVIDASGGLEEESMECPRKSDLLIALEGLQKRSLVSTNGSTIQADSLKIQRNIDKHFTKNEKQNTIKDF